MNSAARNESWYRTADGNMTIDRCHEILKACVYGAGGYILRSEKQQMLAAGLLAESDGGLVITPLGRRTLVQS
jgi:ribosomal protein S19E (S16A)